jgi:OPA family sugar phosphate sensor protein UhpC-like MFS transporter
LIARFLAAFRQHPEAPRLTDASAIQARYARLRTDVLWGSMAAYALFYFCRKNISVALPLLSEELGYSNTQLGVLGSTLYITYGACKFLSGLVADRARPAIFITTGLMLSAFANLLFGLSTSLIVFGVLWGLNGVFQSTGAPGSAKILAGWFGAGERGTKTAIWNISHQGGG